MFQNVVSERGLSSCRRKSQWYTTWRYEHLPPHSSKFKIDI